METISTSRRRLLVLASIMEREPKQLIYSIDEINCSLASMRRAIMDEFEFDYKQGYLTPEIGRAFLATYQFLGRFFNERSARLCEELVRNEDALDQNERDLLHSIRDLVFSRCDGFLWEFKDFQNELFGSLEREIPSFSELQFFRLNPNLEPTFEKFIDSEVA